MPTLLVTIGREVQHAYMMLDIYSRKNIHWEVRSTGNGELATDFITNCVMANCGVMPGTINSITELR